MCPIALAHTVGISLREKEVTTEHYQQSLLPPLSTHLWNKYMCVRACVFVCVRACVRVCVCAWWSLLSFRESHPRVIKLKHSRIRGHTVMLAVQNSTGKSDNVINALFCSLLQERINCQWASWRVNCPWASWRCVVSLWLPSSTRSTESR